MKKTFATMIVSLKPTQTIKIDLRLVNLLSSTIPFCTLVVMLSGKMVKMIIFVLSDRIIPVSQIFTKS